MGDGESSSKCARAGWLRYRKSSASEAFAWSSETSPSSNLSVCGGFPDPARASSGRDGGPRAWEARAEDCTGLREGELVPDSGKGGSLSSVVLFGECSRSASGIGLWGGVDI